ncbi:MAG: peroxiredoxin [Spirochaetae bacterium HGW-Spirochaetae-1]|jgi:peroxiredoxin (alkyl hydroperoxide reductase subunit C)|nr:MAG: peroxiredoxin [Spirochaetae bacterium HGW-Spirochaetae-1]
MKILRLVIIGIVFFLFCSCSDSVNTVGKDSAASGPKTLLNHKIPAMTLTAFQKGRISDINLASYRGQWLILFFYPGDFTFVCPTELKELADYYKEFRGMGAEILSISTDSAVVHRAWHGQNESIKTIEFPMLSDRGGKLCRELGVYNENEGSAERATLIVNPDGSIIAYEVHHQDIGRSTDELLRKLSAAIATRQGGGGMCPGGWKQGDKLIHAE